MIAAAFWTVCGAAALLLILSAFFSGSETALTAASRGKLKARAEKGEKGAERDNQQYGQQYRRRLGG